MNKKIPTKITKNNICMVNEQFFFVYIIVSTYFCGLLKIIV